jgi:hypothetical protein
MMTMRSRPIGVEALVSHTDITSDVVDLPFYFILVLFHWSYYSMHSVGWMPQGAFFGLRPWKRDLVVFAQLHLPGRHHGFLVGSQGRRRLGFVCGTGSGVGSSNWLSYTLSRQLKPEVSTVDVNSVMPRATDRREHRAYGYLFGCILS